MKRRIVKVIFAAMLIFLYCLRVTSINRRYENYEYTYVAKEDMPMMVNDKEEFKITIELSNSTKRELELVLSQIVLVKDTSCEIISVSEFYQINDLPSLTIRVLPGHSGSIVLPFRHYKYLDEMPDINIGSKKDYYELHFRLGFPYLNQNIVYKI